MNNNTIYVGMDVHKESFTLCCMKLGDENPSHLVRVDSDYLNILKYIESLRHIYGQESIFICGYEAGCLGYSLYHQLSDCDVECVILAPTTMAKSSSQKSKKTDKRDAQNIAQCLAYHTYKPVHIPTEEDDNIRDFIRMRDDHKADLKRHKQQILSFCLRHNYVYRDGHNWTQKHLSFLRKIDCCDMHREILNEYLITYDYLVDKLERFDRRIEELANGDKYKADVEKLSCFLGIKTATAMATLVEVGDFSRFSSADKFASYIGLTPAENSSGDDINRLGITKAGNSHVRKLLIEAAHSYGRGQVGYTSAALKQRQSKCSPEVIAYANRANERLRRKYYKMVLSYGKRANVAKTAVARELACFIWGMLTNNIA